MRKIRPRSIAYGSKALLVQRSLNDDRIEYIPHVARTNVDHGSNREDKGGHRFKDQDEESLLQLIGSVVSPSLCYLRSIPVLPSLDQFQKMSKKAPNARQIVYDVVLNHIEKNPYSIEDVANLYTNSLDLNYLLCFGENLESRRRFCETNVIITTDASRGLDSSLILIPHHQDLPKQEIDPVDQVSMKKNYASLFSTLGTTIGAGGRKSRCQAKIESGKVNIGEDRSSSNISHIKGYFEFLKPSCTENERAARTNRWFTDRKKRWKEESFLRESNNIVQSTSQFYFHQIMANTKFQISCVGDRYISYDVNYIDKASTSEVESAHTSRRDNRDRFGMDFVTEIKLHLKPINDKKKRSLSPCQPSSKHDIRSLVLKSSLTTNDTHQPTHHTLNMDMAQDNPPLQIVEDPPHPKDMKTRGEVEIVYPVPTSGYKVTLNPTFMKIQQIRSLNRKSFQSHSLTDVFRYRTIGTIMNPYNELGGAIIPHVKHINPLLFNIIHGQNESLGVVDFSRIFARNLFGSSTLALRAMNYKDKPRHHSHLKRDRDDAETVAEKSSYMSVTQYIGLRFVNNRDTTDNLCGFRDMDTKQLFGRFEALQSMSVGLRGELLHLLSKSIEFENEFNRESNFGLELTNLIEDAFRAEIEDTTAYKQQKGKRQRESSRDSKRDRKKRKKRKKDKHKRRSSEKKRQRETELERNDAQGVFRGPSLNKGSAPIIITHAKYEVTTIHQNSETNNYQQRPYDNRKENAPRIAIPSIPVEATPIVVLPRPRPRAFITNDNYIEESKANQITPPPVNTERAAAENYRPSPSFEEVVTTPEVGGESTNVKTLQNNPDSNKDEPTLNKDGLVLSELREPPGNTNSQIKYYHPNATDAYSTLLLSSNQRINTDDFPTKTDSYALLCSENFLETWSQAASELSSGLWQNNLLLETEEDGNTSVNRRIILHDCILVDDCRVDFELPNNSSIKIVSLASLSRAPKLFIKEFVQLAACGRYKTIHLMFIVDRVELNEFTVDIANLQNAIVKQKGCPCDSLYIDFTKPNVLSTAIAMIATQHRVGLPLNKLSFENNILEQARFLLSLVPSFTAFECLQLLDLNAHATMKDRLKHIVHLPSTNLCKQSKQQLNVALTANLRNYPLA